MNSIALELRDRMFGSVVHVDDVTDYLCNRCKHGEEGSLVNNGHREHCILCAGAESFDGHGNKSEHCRMAVADLLDMVNNTALQGPVTDVSDFLHLLAFSHLGVIPFPADESLTLLHRNKGKSVCTELYHRVGRFAPWHPDCPMPDGGPRCLNPIICRYCSGRRGTKRSWGAPLNQYSEHCVASKKVLGGDGLEHSLLLYRYSMPPHNRKATKSRPCSFRGADSGVMERFTKLPEPVVSIPI